MADDFDPRTQVFYLLAADGETQVPVPLDALTAMRFYDIRNGINFGSQAGACIMLLIVAVCLLPRLSLVRFSQWLQLCTLVLNSARNILFACYFTSAWNESFTILAGDYSQISQANIVNNCTTEALSLIILILVQIMLYLQAWAMVNLLSRRLKWSLAVLSGLISLTTIILRFMAAVLNIQAFMGLERKFGLVDAAFLGSGILQAVSVFWYCVLFNSKLVAHLIRHRGVLPSRNGLTAMEVLVITNGLLMVGPGRFLFRTPFFQCPPADHTRRSHHLRSRIRQARQEPPRGRLPGPHLHHPHPHPRHPHRPARLPAPGLHPRRRRLGRLLRPPLQARPLLRRLRLPHHPRRQHRHLARRGLAALRSGRRRPLPRPRHRQHRG